MVNVLDLECRKWWLSLGRQGQLECGRWWLSLGRQGQLECGRSWLSLGRQGQLECGRSWSSLGRQDQIKDHTIGIWSFYTKHAALRSKSKDWLTRNVSEWNDMSWTCITVDCCLSELTLGVFVQSGYYHLGCRWWGRGIQLCVFFSKMWLKFLNCAYLEDKQNI